MTHHSIVTSTIETIKEIAAGFDKPVIVSGEATLAAEGLIHQRLTIGDTAFLLCVNVPAKSFKLRNIKDGDISTTFDAIKVDIKWA